MEKFLVTTLAANTDRFSKGLTANDRIDAIGDLADGGITFLGPAGILVVPGATGAALTANLGLTPNTYGMFIVKNGTTLNKGVAMNGGRISYAKQTYVTPTAMVYALGYNAATGMTTNNITSVDLATNVGKPVTLRSTNPNYPPENPLHVRAYTTNILPSDTVSAILDRLVALGNADANRHATFAKTNSTTYYGVSITALDKGVLVSGKLDDGFVGTIGGKVSGVVGTPTAALLEIEKDAMVRVGHNPAPSARYLDTITPKIDVSVSYVAYFITCVNTTESKKTDFDIEQTIVIPSAATALIADMDDMLNALCGSSSETWA